MSPVELVRASIAAIERVDPAVNAMVVRADERALQEAAQAEAAVRNGDKLGPLHGLPVAMTHSTFALRCTRDRPRMTSFVADTPALYNRGASNATPTILHDSHSLCNLHVRVRCGITHVIIA